MLRGEHVLLRPFTTADLPLLNVWYNDVEFELLGGGRPPRPHTAEEVRAWYDKHIASGEAPDVGFVIEVDGAMIGTCGLFRFDETNRTCELGIGIGDRESRGRGYGREAIRLLLDYAFRLRNQRRVWLRTTAANERALRAYRACGFVEEGRLRRHVWNDGHYVDEVYLGVLRDEWNDTPC